MKQVFARLGSVAGPGFPARRALSFTLAATFACATLGCGGGNDEPAPEAAATPDEAYHAMVNAVADGKPDLLWHGLPASYQSDIEGVIHDAAKQMDPEVWNTSFSVLGKFTRVLSEKREFILEHPMVAGNLAQDDASQENFDAVVSFMEVLVESDIKDLDRVQELEVADYLATTGRDMFAQISEMSEMTDEDGWAETAAKLRASTATTVSTEGADAATIEIQAPGEPTEQKRYVRVEGKWVPASIADTWDTEIGDLRKKLADVSSPESEADRRALVAQLNMMDAMLDQVLAAESKEEFNASVNGLLGMAMGAAMSAGGGA